MEILLVLGQYLLPVLAGILVLLGIAGIKKLLDKWGVQRSEAIDDMIDNYVRKGVNFAEVMARKYLAANNAKMSGESKQAKAVKVVMDELEQSGVKGVAEDLVIARIESWLEDSGKEPGIPSAPESVGESS